MLSNNKTIKVDVNTTNIDNMTENLATGLDNIAATLDKLANQSDNTANNVAKAETITTASLAKPESAVNVTNQTIEAVQEKSGGFLGGLRKAIGGITNVLQNANDARREREAVAAANLAAAQGQLENVQAIAKVLDAVDAITESNQEKQVEIDELSKPELLDKAQIEVKVPAQVKKVEETVKEGIVEEVVKETVKSEPVKETVKEVVKTEPVKEVVQEVVKTKPVQTTISAVVQSDPVKQAVQEEIKPDLTPKAGILSYQPTNKDFARDNTEYKNVLTFSNENSQKRELARLQAELEKAQKEYNRRDGQSSDNGRYQPLVDKYRTQIQVIRDQIQSLRDTGAYTRADVQTISKPNTIQIESEAARAKELTYLQKQYDKAYREFDSAVLAAQNPERVRKYEGLVATYSRQMESLKAYGAYNLDSVVLEDKYLPKEEVQAKEEKAAELESRIAKVVPTAQVEILAGPEPGPKPEPPKPSKKAQQKAEPKMRTIQQIEDVPEPIQKDDRLKYQILPDEIVQAKGFVYGPKEPSAAERKANEKLAADAEKARRKAISDAHERQRALEYAEAAKVRAEAEKVKSVVAGAIGKEDERIFQEQEVERLKFQVMPDEVVQASGFLYGPKEATPEQKRAREKAEAERVKAEQQERARQQQEALAKQYAEAEKVKSVVAGAVEKEDSRIFQEKEIERLKYQVMPDGIVQAKGFIYGPKEPTATERKANEKLVADAEKARLKKIQEDYEKQRAIEQAEAEKARSEAARVKSVVAGAVEKEDSRIFQEKETERLKFQVLPDEIVQAKGFVYGPKEPTAAERKASEKLAADAEKARLKSIQDAYEKQRAKEITEAQTREKLQPNDEEFNSLLRNFQARVAREDAKSQAVTSAKNQAPSIVQDILKELNANQKANKTFNYQPEAIPDVDAAIKQVYRKKTAAIEAKNAVDTPKAQNLTKIREQREQARKDSPDQTVKQTAKINQQNEKLRANQEIAKQFIQEQAANPEPNLNEQGDAQQQVIETFVRAFAKVTMSRSRSRVRRQFAARDISRGGDGQVADSMSLADLTPKMLVQTAKEDIGTTISEIKAAAIQAKADFEVVKGMAQESAPVVKEQVDEALSVVNDVKDAIATTIGRLVQQKKLPVRGSIRSQLSTRKFARQYARNEKFTAANNPDESGIGSSPLVDSRSRDEKAASRAENKQLQAIIAEQVATDRAAKQAKFDQERKEADAARNEQIKDYGFAFADYSKDEVEVKLAAFKQDKTATANRKAKGSSIKKDSTALSPSEAASAGNLPGLATLVSKVTAEDKRLTSQPIDDLRAAKSLILAEQNKIKEREQAVAANAVIAEENRLEIARAQQSELAATNRSFKLYPEKKESKVITEKSVPVSGMNKNRESLNFVKEILSAEKAKADEPRQAELEQKKAEQERAEAVKQAIKAEAEAAKLAEEVASAVAPQESFSGFVQSIEKGGLDAVPVEDQQEAVSLLLDKVEEINVEIAKADSLAKNASNKSTSKAAKKRISKLNKDKSGIVKIIGQINKTAANTIKQDLAASGINPEDMDDLSKNLWDEVDKIQAGQNEDDTITTARKLNQNYQKQAALEGKAASKGLSGKAAKTDGGAVTKTEQPASSFANRVRKALEDIAENAAQEAERAAQVEVEIAEEVAQAVDSLPRPSKRMGRNVTDQTEVRSVSSSGNSGTNIGSNGNFGNNNGGNGGGRPPTPPNPPSQPSPPNPPNRRSNPYIDNYEKQQTISERAYQSAVENEFENKQKTSVDRLLDFQYLQTKLQILTSVLSNFFTTVANKASEVEDRLIKLRVFYNGDNRRVSGDLRVATEISREFGGTKSSYLGQLSGVAASNIQSVDRYGTILSKKFNDSENQSLARGIAAASKVNQLDNNTTKSVQMAIEQMFSKGQVQSQELKLQLGNALPGAVNLMAQAMGISTSQLGKRMETEQVSSNEVFKLGDYFNILFSEAAKKPTLKNELSKAEGQLNEIGVAAAQPVGGVATGVLQFANAMMGGIEKNAGALTLAFLPLGAIVGKALFSSLAASLAANKIAQEAMSPIAASFAKNKGSLAVGGTLLAASVIASQAYGTEGLDKTINKLGDAVKGLSEVIGTVFSQILNKGQEVGKNNSGLNAVVGIAGLAGILFPLLTGFAQGVGQANLSLGKFANIGDGLSSVTSKIKEKLTPAAVGEIVGDEGGVAGRREKRKDQSLLVAGLENQTVTTNQPVKPSPSPVAALAPTVSTVPTISTVPTTIANLGQASQNLLKASTLPLVDLGQQGGAIVPSRGKSGLTFNSAIEAEFVDDSFGGSRTRQNLLKGQPILKPGKPTDITPSPFSTASPFSPSSPISPFNPANLQTPPASAAASQTGAIAKSLETTSSSLVTSQAGALATTNSLTEKLKSGLSSFVSQLGLTLALSTAAYMAANTQFVTQFESATKELAKEIKEALPKSKSQVDSLIETEGTNKFSFDQPKMVAQDNALSAQLTKAIYSGNMSGFEVNGELIRQISTERLTQRLANSDKAIAKAPQSEKANVVKGYAAIEAEIADRQKTNRTAEIGGTYSQISKDKARVQLEETRVELSRQIKDLVEGTEEDKKQAVKAKPSLVAFEAAQLKLAAIKSSPNSNIEEVETAENDVEKARVLYRENADYFLKQQQRASTLLKLLDKSAKTATEQGETAQATTFENMATDLRKSIPDIDKRIAKNAPDRTLALRNDELVFQAEQQKKVDFVKNLKILDYKTVSTNQRFKEDSDINVGYRTAVIDDRQAKDKLESQKLTTARLKEQYDIALKSPSSTPEKVDQARDAYRAALTELTQATLDQRNASLSLAKAIEERLLKSYSNKIEDAVYLDRKGQSNDQLLASGTAGKANYELAEFQKILPSLKLNARDARLKLGSLQDAAAQANYGYREERLDTNTRRQTELNNTAGVKRAIGSFYEDNSNAAQINIANNREQVSANATKAILLQQAIDQSASVTQKAQLIKQLDSLETEQIRAKHALTMSLIEAEKTRLSEIIRITEARVNAGQGTNQAYEQAKLLANDAVRLEATRPQGFQQDTNLTTARADLDKARADLAVIQQTQQLTITDNAKLFNRPEYSNVAGLVADGSRGKNTLDLQRSARFMEAQLATVESQIPKGASETDRIVDYKKQDGSVVQISLLELQAITKQMGLLATKSEATDRAQVAVNQSEIRYQQAQSAAQYELQSAKKQAQQVDLANNNALRASQDSRTAADSQAGQGLTEYFKQLQGSSFGDTFGGLRLAMEGFTQSAGQLEASRDEAIKAANLSYEIEVGNKKRDGINDPIIDKAATQRDSAIKTAQSRFDAETNQLFANKGSQIVTSLRQTAEGIDKALVSLKSSFESLSTTLAKVTSDIIRSGGSVAESILNYSVTGVRDVKGADGKVIQVDRLENRQETYTQEVGSKQAAEARRDFDINQADLQTSRRKINQSLASVEELGDSRSIEKYKASDAYKGLSGSVRAQLEPLLANITDTGELKENLRKSLTAFANQIDGALSAYTPELKQRLADMAIRREKLSNASRVAGIASDVYGKEFSQLSGTFNALSPENRYRLQVEKQKADFVRSDSDAQLKIMEAEDRFSRNQGSQEEVDNLKAARVSNRNLAQQSIDQLVPSSIEFVQHIKEAVIASAGIGSAIKKALSEGNWGNILNDVLSNVLNNLADRYSQVAANFLGDAVMGIGKSIIGDTGVKLPETEIASLTPPMATEMSVATPVVNLNAGMVNGLDGLFGGLDDMAGIGKTAGMDIFAQNMPLSSLFSGGKDADGEIDFLSFLPSFGKGMLDCLPSYSEGTINRGTDYPKTPYQDPREPYESRLAVINSNELVVPAGMASEFLSYRSAGAAVQGVQSVNTTNNRDSSTNISNNTYNYPARDVDTFNRSESARYRSDSQFRRRNGGN